MSVWKERKPQAGLLHQACKAQAAAHMMAERAKTAGTEEAAKAAEAAETAKAAEAEETVEAAEVAETAKALKATETVTRVEAAEAAGAAETVKAAEAAKAAGTTQTVGANVLDVHIRQAGYEQGKAQISEISLSIKPGGLTGLIGPNGAGKSTSIKAIIGVLPYVDADIVFGSAAKSYAYVPEQPVFYETLTLWEHLALAAAVCGLDEPEFERQADGLLAKFRMTEVRDLLPTGFSKGMQQKMMLMIGFLAKPGLYIVDEPFIGLDPRATRDFLGLLDEERRRGAGVLMSTHVLDTAERICDDFVLIDRGRVAASGTLAEIRSRCGNPEASLFDCFDQLT